MSIAEKYLTYAQEKLQQIMEREMPNICKAAEIVAESCKNGGKFYIFGTGHSHMIAEELYLRAGGLALVHGILPPELMLHEMPTKSTLLERLEGYAEALADIYHVEGKDVVMVVSNSGRNALPVEMCLAARKRGAKVIALTSLSHSAGCASRHSSGQKIYQLADVTIDNCAEPGDAAMQVEGVPTGIGPISTVTGAAIAQALACQVVENMVNAGVTPPVFRSSNVDGGDEFNEEIFNRYYGYWK